MSQLTISNKWTTDELLELLSYIESHSSDSLPKTCEKAINHLNINRTYKSVYSKVSKLIHAMKFGDMIVREDDRVYKLLEKIYESKKSMKNKSSAEEQKQELRGDVFVLNQQVKSSNVIDKSEEQDFADNLSDSTVDGDYTDHLDLYRNNKEQLPIFHLPLKILNDRIYEAEREVYENISSGNEDIDYHQVFQIIKQIKEYRDEVCGLFEEFEKKINEIRSL